MGCNQSGEANQPKLPINKTPNLTKTFPPATRKDQYILTMIGNTSLSAMVVGFTQNSFEPLSCQVPIPRYCNSLLHNKNVGYITGGIEDLEANVSEKATIDAQILEGVISKKFIKVDIGKLLKDPPTSFDLMPEMINSRYAHCSIILKGYLYVIGGRQYGTDENGLLSACEKYDFEAEKWKAIPSLQYPRAAAAVIVYGEHLYVFGGYSGNNTRTRVIQSYSDGDSGWRKVPFNLHEGLQGSLIFQKPGTDSSILVFGGKTSFQKSNRVFEINFDKSTVLSLGSMKQERNFHKGKVVGSDVYLIGGGSEHIEIYNLLQQTTSISKQLSYLQFCSMKQLNSFSQFQEQVNLKYKKKIADLPAFQNKVYMFGHAHEAFTKILNTDNFLVASDGQSLYHNFYQFSNVIKVNKEHCFVLGGISSDFGDVTNIAYSFSLKNDQIKVLDPMLQARYGFSTVVMGSYLYVIGGRKLGDDDVALMNQCERFSFESYKWEQIASLKYKRQCPIVVTVSNFVVVIGGYKGNGVRSNEMELYIEAENRWVQLDAKFQLSVESMSSVTYQNTIYLFGGRADSTDIQKVFRLNMTIDENVKYQKSLKVSLEPVGNLSNPGTNLKVYVNPVGLAYVFGNIPHGIDVYDIMKHKVVQTEVLPIFQKLGDKFFQSYTLLF